jgi:hypothetical protein
VPVSRPKKIKVKKEEFDSEDIKPDISKLMEIEDDSDFSDDVSPMNPEAYQAQKRRRDERIAQRKVSSQGPAYRGEKPLIYSIEQGSHGRATIRSKARATFTALQQLTRKSHEERRG